MNIQEKSVLHYRVPAEKVRQYNYSMDEDLIKNVEGAAKTFGVDVTIIPRAFESGELNSLKFAMDNVQPTVTTPSITVPLQYLQTFFPGLVYVATQIRKIDDLIGFDIIGSWEDAQIVQGELDPTGNPQEYNDYSNTPISSYNVNYEPRNIVRFEQGMRIGRLDEARAARANINAAKSRREAAVIALEILRNIVGFSGYNSGSNLTYGLLNDPALTAYVSFANGASSSSEWVDKTYEEITKDIQAMAQELIDQSGGNVDAQAMPTTLVIAQSVSQYLATVPQFGNSVRKFITETYPQMKIKSAPQFNGANGGENVAYLFADEVRDSSTDNGAVFSQMVPTKFKTIGVEQRIKSYLEDFSNATAGILTKRPYAVVRFTGN